MAWVLEPWQGDEERIDTQTRVQESWGPVGCVRSDGAASTDVGNQEHTGEGLASLCSRSLWVSNLKP